MTSKPDSQTTTPPTEKPERSLEQQVFDAIRESFAESVQKRLVSDYHGPFGKLIEQAVAQKESELKALILDAFTESTSGSIREQIKVAAAHKIAKVLVSKMEGEIEKRVNDLRADPVTRARIILAVEGAINDVPKKA